jgi:transcriptional regulator with XRE-family HTH domain
MQSANIMLRTKLLGALLREVRKDSGKSLKEAAKLFGSTSGKLSSFEHGRKGISLPELELFAYHVDTPMERFLTGKSSRPKPQADFDPEAIISLRQKMIGAQLRKDREEVGMTIKDLAAQIGFPVSRLRAYERGARPIPIPELENILGALGKPLEEYFDTQGPVGKWINSNRGFKAFLSLPQETQDFLAEPGNDIYILLAQRLSEMSIEKIKMVGELFLELSR